MKRNLLLALCILGFSHIGNAQKDTQFVHNRMNEFIEGLIAKMTLDEKLGQLNLPAAGDITTGQARSEGIGKKIAAGKVGGLFNIKGIEKIRAMQQIAVEQSRLKIPLIFGMDVIHGYVTNFPIPLALASSWDMNLVQQSARIAAIEASASGINWTFSPMVDVARDPRWGRVAEGAGEDPYLGSAIARAMVKGYQGDDLSAGNAILACVKHFALYGAAEAGRDYNTVDMSRVRMYNEYFPPYKAAVEAGVGSVMASFNEVDAIPATANKWLQTDVLRNQWGFNGFVVTDYTGINEMIEHGIGDLQTVSALALKAGIDMDMVGEGFLTTLKKSLLEKKVTIGDINESVRRVLEAKYKLGLFKNPYLYLDSTREKNEVYSKEHRNIARYIATQSMVLMENNGILPLKQSGTVAVIGPLADNAENMPGMWSVAAKHSEAVSVLKGFKEIVPNVNFIYAKGANIDYDENFEKRVAKPMQLNYRDKRPVTEIIGEAINVAKRADIVVLAIGESAEMSGESSSRTNIKVPQSQLDLLKEIRKTGKPVVVLLFTGRPLELGYIKENSDAILNVWFPGSEGGYAIADVVFGKVNPSAKLPMTFPRSVGQIPIYYAHKNTGRPLNQQKTKAGAFEKFRSAYLDEANTPLYPFGYGLNYSKFVYSDITTDKKVLRAGDVLKVSVTVTNSGQYDGAEIVQLYIRDIVGNNTRPVKELKGFRKVYLKSGESKKVTFEITTNDLKYYDNNLKYIWEPGEFIIMLGNNSEEYQKLKILACKE
ncbi:MAG TPA: beta-glucosidase BglX [Niabella sp.]|nr:beta-glucosidase BglX [Niabella sp.]